jgi:hypothetical protein
MSALRETQMTRAHTCLTIQSDIPEGMTLVEYRATLEPATPHISLAAVVERLTLHLHAAPEASRGR